MTKTLYEQHFPDADWLLIPEHCREGLLRHFETGGLVGDFLTAVLSNDLMKAASKADDENRISLHRYARFLYNFAPPASYGSPEKVKAWRERGGLRGRPEQGEVP